jgi:hypothetical protein
MMQLRKRKNDTGLVQQLAFDASLATHSRSQVVRVVNSTVHHSGRLTATSVLAAARIQRPAKMALLPIRYPEASENGGRQHH